LLDKSGSALDQMQEIPNSGSTTVVPT